MNVCRGDGRRRTAARPRSRSAAAHGFAFPRELAARLDGDAAAGHDVIARRPAGRRAGRAREAAAGYVPVEAHIIEPLGAYDIVDLKLGDQLPPRPHRQRLRRQAGRHGLGQARPGAGAFLRRRPPATSLDVRLGAWRRSGSTTSASASAPQPALDGADRSTSPTASSSCCSAPTGAGKTTTLRLIAGLEKPDRGPDPHRRRGRRATGARPSATSRSSSSTTRSTRATRCARTSSSR